MLGIVFIQFFLGIDAVLLLLVSRDNFHNVNTQMESHRCPKQTLNVKAA